MQDFGLFNISNNLPPQPPLTVTVNQGWEYVRVINKSPFMLKLDFGGMGKTDMPEMYLEDFLVTDQFNGRLTITPSIDLSNTSQAITNTVAVDTFVRGELSAPKAQPLTQQAVNVTASGKPLFTATVGFGSTVNIGQQLNIFNPPGSGVIATFHSAKAFSNSSSVPTSNLLFLVGADNNLANPVAAVAHDASAKPPVSVMHCTSNDTNVSVGGTIIEVIDMQQNVTQDMLVFPDNYTLEPGANLTIQMSDAAGGHVVRLTLKWSEAQLVPPPSLEVNLSTATNLINTGNPSPTPIVTAAPTGDGATATLINNNGTETLGDALHAGKLVMAGAGNPAIDLSAASIVQAIKFIVGSVTRWSMFSGTATTVATAFAHGLGVKPDIILMQLTIVSSTAHGVYYNPAIMDATNVNIQSDGTNTFVALAIKF